MRAVSFGGVRTAMVLASVVAIVGGAPARAVAQDGGGEAIPVVEQIVNVVRQPWFRGLILQPQAEMDYEETAMFDALLHKSLRAKQPTVTVQVAAAFQADAVPARMGSWLRRIQARGGAVGQCQQEELSTGVMVLNLVIGLIPEFNRWAT